MHDKNKIRIMAKMAVYDKHNFDKDAKANQYFRHDFIYKNNSRTRFFVGIGCAILVLFYILYLLAVEDVDIFTLNYQALGIQVLLIVLVIMVAYSFLGTILHTRDFLRSQKRINGYFALMNELEGRDAAKDKQAAQANAAPVDDDADDDENADFEPYRGGGRPNDYRYRTTGDPEFWDDKDES